MSATFDNLDRRGFFRIGALAGGGFLLGSWTGAAAEGGSAFSPNAFVRITPGGLRESHVHDIVITEEPTNYQPLG